MAGGKIKVAIAPVNDDIGPISDSVSAGIVRGLEYYTTTSNEKFSISFPKEVAKVMRQNNITSLDLSDDQSLQRLGRLLKSDIIACAELTTDGSIMIRLMFVADGSYKIVGSNAFYSIASVGPAVQDIFYREVCKTNDHCKNIGFVRSDVPVAVTNGLAGYWTFDDQTGRDVSDYENTSKIGGKKPLFTTNTPSGYGFACMENYLEVKEHLLNATQWTVCMWVYFPKKWNNVIQILSEQSEKENVNYFGYETKITGETSVITNVDYRYVRQSDGTFKKEKDGYSASGRMYKDLNYTERFGEGWHHVAVIKSITKKEEPIIIYVVDGINVVNHISNRKRQYVGDLFMGWHAPAYDNVRIYERGLDLDEIREIYKTEQ